MGNGLSCSSGLVRIEQELGLQELASARSTPRSARPQQELSPQQQQQQQRGTAEGRPRVMCSPLLQQQQGEELWRWLENLMIEVQGAETSHVEVRWAKGGGGRCADACGAGGRGGDAFLGLRGKGDAHALVHVCRGVLCPCVPLWATQVDLGGGTHILGVSVGRWDPCPMLLNYVQLLISFSSVISGFLILTN